ncbi:MAG: TIM barrel protein [Planctomycetota bacterium]
MYRRQFLASSSAAAAAATLAAGPLPAAAESRDARRPPVVVFTKSFQNWPLSWVAQAFDKLGVDGFDLTVRPGGSIEPEDAAAKLPAAIADAKNYGLNVLFLTTAITDAGPGADRLMGVAAENGVTTLKVGYFRQRGAPLAKRLDEVRATLEKIGTLAEKHGITACVHTHSGDYLPSHGTMLYSLLKDLPPEQIGAYVDTLHMHAEGGEAGWRQGLELLAPWIRLCAVKNYRREPNGRDASGMAKYRKRVVPVADGFSPIPAFVNELKKWGFAGPFSLHSEYKGGDSWKRLKDDEVLDQTRRDWEFFRSVLDTAYRV